MGQPHKAWKGTHCNPTGSVTIAVPDHKPGPGGWACGGRKPVPTCCSGRGLATALAHQDGPAPADSRTGMTRPRLARPAASGAIT